MYNLLKKRIRLHSYEVNLLENSPLNFEKYTFSTLTESNTSNYIAFVFKNIYM